MQTNKSQILDQESLQATSDKPVFVLVHGAWHGGWCWQQVTRILQRQAYSVYTPTLSGLGERKHTFSPDIDLTTHIEDIVNLVEMEDLQGIILVGHSYAGAVIAGVADQIPQRIAKLIFLDAFLVENGQSALSVQDPESQRAVQNAVQQQGQGMWMNALPAAVFGIDNEPDRQWVDERLTRHPFKTFTQPLQLVHPLGNNLPKIYIACTTSMLSSVKAVAERIKHDTSWTFLTLNTGHDAMMIMPEAVSELFIKCLSLK